MIRYESTKQLTIQEFKTPFQTSLCLIIGGLSLLKWFPGDKFASIYISMMNKGFGRPAVSPLIILGARIIKHKEKLEDRRVVDAIQ